MAAQTQTLDDQETGVVVNTSDKAARDNAKAPGDDDDAAADDEPHDGDEEEVEDEEEVLEDDEAEGSQGYDEDEDRGFEDAQDDITGNFGYEGEGEGEEYW